MWSFAIIVDFLSGARKVTARWLRSRRETFPAGGRGSLAPASHCTVSELPHHTIFAPAKLEDNVKLPLLVWANGFGLSWGLMFGEFLREIASHGYIVVANGAPNGLGSTDERGQLQAIEWASKVPQDEGDIRIHVDATRIALAGQSKGAIHTLIAASTLRTNERIKSVGILNSGLMRRRASDLNLVSGLVTSVYYFVGDDRDVLFKNAERDWELIPRNVRAYFASLDVGHLGTFYDESGGLFAEAVVNWLDYELKGDEYGKRKLLEARGRWKIKHHNL